MSDPALAHVRLLAAAFIASASLGCVLYVDDTQCGAFAYDYRGACYCEDGYEGDDPEGAGCDPVMTFRITDACDDDGDVAWKIFSDDRDWSWPSGDDVYWTEGLDYDALASVVCENGEFVCFGAESESGLVWGVGLDFDADADCDDCCFRCGAYEQDLGFLTCN